MILQKIEKSIENAGIPCFFSFEDITDYCAVLIPIYTGKESAEVQVEFIWKDNDPEFLAEKWIKSLRVNKEIKAVVLGSGNNDIGYALRVKAIYTGINASVLVSPAVTYYVNATSEYPQYVTTSGSGYYSPNTSCTVSATITDNRYYFGGWADSEDTLVSNDNPYTFTVTENTTLYAIVNQKYHVETLHEFDSTTTGDGWYAPGESCTVTAIPNTGYHFVKWNVNGLEVSTSNPYTFIPTASVQIEAVCDIDQFTVSASGTGGSISGTGSYNYGQTCTLTATPNTGYQFASWQEYGEITSTNNPYSFTVNSNRTFTAVFNQINYSVSATSSGNGTVSGGGTYHYGDSVTLTATPSAGYQLANWTEGGVQVSTSNPYTFTCSGSRTIVANFELIPPTQYTISASSAGHGSVSGSGTYNDGSTCTLTATPDTGYQFTSFTENGVVVSSSNPYSFTVNANRTIVANFTIISYTISATSSGNGTVSGGGSYNYGATVTLSATPSTDYEFTDWTEGGVQVSTSNPYSFTCTGNRTIVGNFDATPTPPSPSTPLTIVANDDYDIVLVNGNDEEYTWSISSGTNIYNGTEPGFALDEITGVYASPLGDWNDVILSIDASGLTSWEVVCDSAFTSCSALTSITLPDSITTLEPSALSGLESLTSITLPSSLTTIGDDAFSGCTSLTSITLPSSVETIGVAAFANCESLTSLTIPANVSSIGVAVVAACIGLTSITVNSNNVSYNDGNGGNCIIETDTNILLAGCQNTVIPEGVERIEELAFQNCAITSITLPSTLTEIGIGSFESSGLTSITIPSDVVIIESAAFQMCESLEEIICEPTTPPTIEEDTLFGFMGTIYVPNASLSDYQNATYWSDFDQDIVGY